MAKSDETTALAMPDSARNCPIPNTNSLPDNLAGRRLAAIEMLAGGQMIKHVAEALSVDPKTLYRWRQEPDFQSALSTRIRERWGETIDKLRSLAGPAVDLLQRQLLSGDMDSTFRSARMVLKVSGFEKALARDQ